MTRFSFWIFLLFLPALALGAAPDVVLKDFEGRDRNINEFIGKGQWGVVAIWAHDCHICNAEMHHLDSFHRDNHQQNAVVLGVTIDGMAKREEARGFVEQHELNFPNLIAEPDQEVLVKFGGGLFIGTPTFYVYDPDGVIVGRHVGPITQEDLEQFIEAQTASLPTPVTP